MNLLDRKNLESWSGNISAKAKNPYSILLLVGSNVDFSDFHSLLYVHKLDLQMFVSVLNLLSRVNIRSKPILFVSTGKYVGTQHDFWIYRTSSNINASVFNLSSCVQTTNLQSLPESF